MGKQPARKHSVCLSYVRWAASPYLVAHVVDAPRRSNQQRCLQRRKVQGVLTGVVRSITKRLALHCIATAVLPLQRVFPHTANQKQDRKLHSGLRQGQATRLSAHRPALRFAIRWGRYTAAANAMKTAHFKKTLTDFNILPTRYNTKNLHWRLRQGQATRLLAHRPAQRVAIRWGRYNATANAMKTADFKKTLTGFNILPSRYDAKKRIGASAKARRRAFQRIARPSARQFGGGGTMPPPMQ